MIEFFGQTPLTKPIIFDTHAHYEDERFSEISDEMFEGFKENGVGGIITCGCDKESSEKALALAEKYDFVYATVGIHPCNIDSGTTISDIKNLAKYEKCIGIGEIGLDYYWVDDNKTEQKEIFISQIELAKSLNLPIIVHDREAHADTLEILKKHNQKGVVHSFSGSVEIAEELLKIGMYFGIGGVITFKNAKKLPDVVKMLPEDKILLETDAPYLAPVPYRSKTNNSSLIYFTAEKIATLRGCTVEHILNTTFANSKKLFNIL